MARKGYYEEKIVKDWLKENRIALFVEAKGTHKKKYYMSANKDQWARAKAMSKEHNVPLYLFVKKPNEPLDIQRIV